MMGESAPAKQRNRSLEYDNGKGGEDAAAAESTAVMVQDDDAV